MRPIRPVTPYMGSKDMSVNASLTLRKLFKWMRTIDPTYKPTSLYRMRLKSKKAARRAKRRGFATSPATVI